MLFGLKRPAAPTGQVLLSRRLALKPPALAHFEGWSSARAASRQQLEPFEPQWLPDELSYRAFLRRVKLAERDRAADFGFTSLIFVRDLAAEAGNGSADAGGWLIGGVTLSNIQRGVSQSANLGYWLASSAAGRGYMTEAVGAKLKFAFENLSLHRVEAATMMGNQASMRVLEKSGFEAIGEAREYLNINGHWRDHRLFQCRKTMWTGTGPVAENLGLPSESPGFGGLSTG